MEESSIKKGSFSCFKEALGAFCKSFPMSLKMYVPVIIYLILSFIFLFSLIFGGIIIKAQNQSGGQQFATPFAIMLIILFFIIAFIGWLQYLRGMGAISLFAKDVFRKEEIKPLKEYLAGAGSLFEIFKLVLWAILGLLCFIFVITILLSFAIKLFMLNGSALVAPFSIATPIFMFIFILFLLCVCSIIFIGWAHRNENELPGDIFGGALKQAFQNFFTIIAYLFFSSLPLFFIAILMIAFTVLIYITAGKEATILALGNFQFLCIVIQPFIAYYYIFMLTKLYLNNIKKENIINE